jgi:hypothetical protein
VQRSILMLAILILLTSACSLPFGVPQGKDSPNDQAPAARPGKRCGDGVCDGPENAENCPDDCVSSLATRPDEASESAPDEAPAEDGILGQVYVEVEIQRQDGEGTCGSPPWGVDHIDGGDFTCPPPKYWYGYDLVATALQNVRITPAGGSNWRITGDKPGGGTYQKAEHWSDGQRVCAPESIDGGVFDFDVQGSYQNGQVVLNLSALPVEVSKWVCDNGNTYERETTLLLIDWAIAMTGDYTDLSATLSERDAVGTGTYVHEYVDNMNPSPENRDHVDASVEFKCIQSKGEGVYAPVACPW